MAVSLIQFRDQRLPPPPSPVAIDVQRRIDFVDDRGHLQDDSDVGYFSLSMPSDHLEIDQDAPLVAALDKSSISRHSSVGNSWGVTAVGRGFDWRRKNDVQERAGKDVAVETHVDNEDRPSSYPPNYDVADASETMTNAHDDIREQVAVATSGAETWIEPSANPLPLLNPTDSYSPEASFPSHTPDFIGETSHLNTGNVSHRSSLESTKQASPITPTSPHSPLMPLRRDTSASSRPIIAGRSQSMYIVANTSPHLDDDSLSPGGDVSPGTKAQRAKAWSRPVSPVRSASHPHPRLQTSGSAPHLPGLEGLTPFTPLVITCGALTTPTTPRSPRLNRSRASQKRISLVAGRKVAGLHYLDVDGLPQPEEEDWLSFGGRGRQRESPENSPGAEDEGPSTPAKTPGYFDEENFETPMGPQRSQSNASRMSKRRTRSRPMSPLSPEEEDPHVGRAGQIKSLGLFNSPLFQDSHGPPTPLRMASLAGKSDAPSSRDEADVKRDSDVTPMTLHAGGFSTSGSFVSLVPQVSDDVQIPAEEAAPVYPALDKPHPDWSLHRMSSSWSISSSSHQHRLSTSTSFRRSDSKGRSPSEDKRGDGVEMMMRRMNSSQSVKRMSSESGRRGGFLGGRTIDDYVILADAGRGAYGLVKRAKERKKPVVEIDEEGCEVIVEDVEPDETVGPPLIIKQIIKSRILADCWKKHPIHGTIPIEIYVMSAVSGTSYVLPKPRAWDPRRFEDPEESNVETNGHSDTMDSSETATPTPGTTTPTSLGLGKVKITFTPLHAEPEHTPQSPSSSKEEEEMTELDTWRWTEGDLIKGHPNICPLEDFFEDSSFYYLVLPATKPSFPTMPAGMEQAIDIDGGRPPSDLFDLVELYPSGLPGPLVRSYLGQIADALSFLHARGICHRDIKDENVVLGEYGRCWLIDFGSSGVIRKNGWDSFSGTLDYAAPEILQGARYAGPPQDVWAYGIVAYVLFVGECPFVSSVEAALGLEDPEGKPAMALRARCSGGPAGFDEGMEADGGGRLGDGMELVRRCLDVDVANRPTMEQVLTCRYLNGGQGWGQPLEVDNGALN